MFGSMVDIQSPTAEIVGEEKKRKNKPQDENIYGLPYYIGWPWNRKQLEIWTSAQPDGRPAEYRWRPLFNAAKFGWRPLLDAVQ